MGPTLFKDRTGTIRNSITSCAGAVLISYSYCSKNSRLQSAIPSSNRLELGIRSSFNYNKNILFDITFNDTR